jgi:hypothetical protein
MGFTKRRSFSIAIKVGVLSFLTAALTTSRNSSDLLSSEKKWQSGLSLCCEARGGSTLLKFLNNNLALICIHMHSLNFFPTISGFFRAAKKKNEAVFRISLKMVNLYEFFYVMKVIGKIHLGYP